MAKRPLILLHGWTMLGEVFDDLADRLGDIAVCHAPDMPGHGASAHHAPTLDACADMVHEIVGHLGNGPAPVLLGWSMGAAASWRYISRFGSDELAGLVTVDMSPKILPSEDWPHGLKGQSAEDVAMSTDRIAGDWPSVVGGIAGNMFASREGVAGFPPERARRLILTHDPTLMSALWKELVALDERATIPKIGVPYLVCSGGQSRVYPASASTWLARTAPGARQQVFAQSGHSPHLEEPEAFAAALRGFIESLDS